MLATSNKFSIRIQPQLTASGLPSWVPPPGQLKSIHANELTSVNACPSNSCWYTESSGQNGPWTNWCGAVFSPDYSELGAMLYWGGGHGGYDGVEFYAFDLSTQSWSRLGEAIPYDFLPDTGADWCDVIYNGQPIPPASHTYSHAVYIPPAGGGGPKGSWCLTFNVYGGGPGSGNGAAGYRPHAFDLSTKTWTRLTTNTTNPPYAYGAYGGAFTDTNKNVIWGMAGSEGQLAIKIDLKVTPHAIVEVPGVYAPPQYFVPVFVPEKNCMIACWVYENGQNNISIGGYDLASGKPVDFNCNFATGQHSARGAGIGMDWCPDTGKFYLYEGFGSTVVYVATPPTGDWKTGVWTWSTETMTGEIPVSALEVQPNALGAQVFSKWKYNRKLKCFMWSQGTVARKSPDGAMRTGAFQLYRPLGT
jgi:hypothetical protein